MGYLIAQGRDMAVLLVVLLYIMFIFFLIIDKIAKSWLYLLTLSLDPAYQDMIPTIPHKKEPQISI